MKNTNILLTPKFEQDPVSNKYVFRKLDGKILTYYNEIVERFFKEKNISDRRTKQSQFYDHVFGGLDIFEKYLDQYALLLDNFNPSNNEFQFPNLDGHVNILAQIRFGWDHNQSLSPEYSKETVDLVYKLDSLMYEKIQLLKRDNPEIVGELTKRILSEGNLLRVNNYLLSQELLDYCDENPSKFNRKDFNQKLEGENGLLKNYFNELNIENQRKERLNIGTSLLSKMFEETKSAFEQRKENYMANHDQQS